MRSRVSSVASPARALWAAAALLAVPFHAAAQPAPAPAEGPAPAAPPGDPALAPAPGESAPEAGKDAAPAAEKDAAKEPDGAKAKDKKSAHPGKVGYDKGFFVKTEDGKYALTFTGRVQPFFSSTRTAGPPKSVANAFEIRRARLTFEGNLHSSALLYKFQADFGKGFVTLKDFHFDAEVAKGVWLRAGQWKRPFSRQQINSSGRLELADRAITDKAFGAGRDIGMAIGNRYEKSPDLEWVLGVFNGTGDGAKLSGVTVAVDPMTGAATATGGAFSNVPKKLLPAVVARVGINRNGIKGYAEADLEGGPLRWGAAASVLLEGDLDDNGQSNQRAEIDFVAKVQGFAATGALYVQTEQEAGADTSVTDAEAAHLGFHLQAGYMLVPKRWQLAARYALVNDVRTKDAVAKDQQEVALAANYYAAGHEAKLVAGVRLVKNGAADLTDNLVFELGANVGW